MKSISSERKQKKKVKEGSNIILTPFVAFHTTIVRFPKLDVTNREFSINFLGGEDKDLEFFIEEAFDEGENLKQQCPSNF